MSLTIVDEQPRRLGRRVEAEIARRRASAVDRTAGRLLDLSDPDARRLLAATIDHVGPGVSSDVGAFDAVLSFAELIRFPDLAAAFGAIDRLLTDDGMLHLFEPIGRPGVPSMMIAAPFSVVPSLRTFHLGRDIPAAMRTTRLIADDLERIVFPTTLVPVRHFISVRARRADASLIPGPPARVGSNPRHDDPEVAP